jgi:drug/metabolite transporter (DMT)-like permease
MTAHQDAHRAGVAGSAKGWLLRQPYLLLTMTMALWAGNAVASRVAVGQVSPMAIVCLRWLIVLVALFFATRGRLLAEIRAARGHWVPIIAFAFFGFTGFNALFYQSALYTSAINIGVIQGTMPAFVMLGSLVAFRTPIRPIQFLGLFVTLAGIAVTVSRGDLAVLRAFDFNVGDLGMVSASVLYSAYSVALRNRPPIPPLAFFAAMSIAAFATSVPLLGYEVATGTVIWPTLKGWLLLAFIGLFASLVAQLMYVRAIEMIGPPRAGLFINLVPIFAALMGVALLGEHLAPYHAVALVLVLGGIWIAERARR